MLKMKFSQQGVNRSWSTRILSGTTVWPEAVLFAVQSEPIDIKLSRIILWYKFVLLTGCTAYIYLYIFIHLYWSTENPLKNKSSSLSNKYLNFMSLNQVKTISDMFYFKPFTAHMRIYRSIEIPIKLKAIHCITIFSKPFLTFQRYWWIANGIKPKQLKFLAGCFGFILFALGS